MESFKRPQLSKSEVVEALPKACVDERAAVEFLEAQRWGDCPCCPHCGDTNVYMMRDRETGERNRDWRWRCRGCKSQFTVRVGTVYEDSPVPLTKWCRAFWESAAAKNGISALELMRKVEVTYKTALFMLHRIRYAMEYGPNAPKLSGIVEIDETFVGGKPRGKPWRHGKPTRDKWTSKIPVVGLVQRGGDVRAQVVADVTAETLKKAIQENIEFGSLMMTDDRSAYRDICNGHGPHASVNHSRGEYVNFKHPLIHSNTIESFFARLKRGLNGTFHAVSKKHLHRYVSEFAFRYNTRGLNDGARTTLLIQKANGKRLVYREPVAGQGAA